MVEPRSISSVPGMGGKVFDFRGTGLVEPSGGRIEPLLMVHHIPVVSRIEGIADFKKLAGILNTKGLAIQASTDGEGNVALFTNFNQLCFGQRGANSLACGVEHMHLTTEKEFTEEQMRAAAWCAHRLWKRFGVPPRRAILGPGEGRVHVKRRGHTSHRNVSTMAGFNDRSDPGPNFRYRHVYELTKFFDEHGRF